MPTAVDQMPGTPGWSKIEHQKSKATVGCDGRGKVPSEEGFIIQGSLFATKGHPVDSDAGAGPLLKERREATGVGRA